MELSPSAHVDTFSRDNLPPTELWPEFLFDIPDVRYPERLNCGTELLDRVVERHGADRPCLLSPTERWTYGDLQRTANQVAHVLADDLGLVPGNRVLLRGPNNPWLVACWFGVLKAGGVVVTTMPLLRPGELQVICDMARVGLALCDARFVDDLAAGAPETRIVTYGGGDADDLGARCKEKAAGFDNVATAADDVALLAFTSGTTGRPKATMHFHRDVLAIADTFSKHVLKPRPDDVFTGSPPLAFTYGLGGLVVFPLRAGAATLLLEKATPDQLLPAMAEHRVSVVFTAPTAYRAMVKDLPDHDVSSLRRCVSAGEMLPAATWQAWHEATGLKIIDGIGATEMLHIFIGSADDDIRPGSTGRPVEGYVACVLDDDGTEVPDGELGRLAVKGPTGCRYLADERQRNYVQHGWNITGDTYVRDADGYFWYQARSDDMIIASGYNIAAPEVEAALLRHDDVFECAVIGAPDPDRGQVVKAHVVLSEGVTGDAAKVRELQDFVKAQIAPYKYPRVIEFVPSLPRTNTGKLQRFRLRDAASDEAGTSAAQPAGA